jgi:hypothetical protein
MYVRIEYLTRIVCASFSVGGVRRVRPVETTTTVTVENMRPTPYMSPRVQLAQGGNAEWRLVGDLREPRGNMELHKLLIIYRASTRLPRRANPQVEVPDDLSMPPFTCTRTSRSLSVKEHTELAQTCASLVAMLTQGVIPL